MTDFSPPLVLAAIVCGLLFFLVLGNFRPDLVSFLPSLRQYAGNWASATWAFAPGPEAKLDQIVRGAGNTIDQLADTYPRPVADVLMSLPVAWRAMHSQGPALNSMLVRHLGAGIDRYTMREAEFGCNTVIGFNFGDGHFHDEQLITVIQRRCHYEPGEFVVAWVESQPVHSRHQHYKRHRRLPGCDRTGHVPGRGLGGRPPLAPRRADPPAGDLDAPPGIRGISCFVVPKVLVEPNGALGRPNRVSCLSIQQKLGIHASPTCPLDVDLAEGYLVGEANHGMRYMFTMMNNARLLVGIQGLGVAGRALAYAKERHQGRAPGAPAGTVSPIVEHPDVRRMLMTQKASIEALHALIYFVAASIDRADNEPDQAERNSWQQLVDLLIPVTKAWGTDLGVELSSMALQVHGGAGYIEETGAAQHYRDARITPIYEGTNGIQAIDLVTRKLPMRQGGVVDDFFARLQALDRLSKRKARRWRRFEPTCPPPRPPCAKQRTTWPRPA